MAEAVDREREDYGDLPMHYDTVQPNRWTFQSTKIRRWVEQQLEGRVLNACAGRTKLAHDSEIMRNDLNPEIDADLHVDVEEIASHVDGEFQTVVFDPPYTEEQALGSYEGYQLGEEAAAKEQFHELLVPGGKVVKFGYSTTCMPMEWGYERLEVAVWNTLGNQPDFLSVADRKPGEPPEDTGWF